MEGALQTEVIIFHFEGEGHNLASVKHTIRQSIVSTERSLVKEIGVTRRLLKYPSTSKLNSSST